ncbi:MAG: T9SS type A sorting domain-containing protein [Saprospiraceae bacterium]|nr:T9SS type A sorting domain-containing protein [Saprospiraceae bacterium]
MKPTLKNNWLALIFFAFLAVFSNIEAQLDSVHYLLEYNPVEDEFDMKIVIAGGTANSIAQRTQANAQISIVVPSESGIEISKRFMPLRNNQYFAGTEPNQWEKGVTVKSPAIRPQYDFYTFVPGLSPSSQYNKLSVGDTIRLFSLKILLNTGCFEDIQLFDKSMIAEGQWEFGDFSQGFTVGGIKQLFRRNLTPVYTNLRNHSYTIHPGDEMILISSVENMGAWKNWSDPNGIELVEISPGMAKISALENARGESTFICRNDEMTDMVCVNVEQKTSSENHIHFDQLQIYPNPATDLVHLSEGDFDSLEIRDITGRVTWSSYKKLKEIEVSSLIPGLYIITFKNKNIQFSRKFVKM